jgi:PAS domain S-box-containing protein
MTTSLRVLVLEDSPTDAAVMLHHLQAAGYAANWRRVETEAEYVACLDPSLDLILADYTLPDFSAPRALQLLRERGWDIPVIVVTGTASEEVAIECMRLGATDYLLKDRLARLGEAVRNALTLRTLRQDRRAAEESQRASEARARLLAEVIEQGSQPFAVGYQDGRLGIYNAAFCRLLGYSEAELRSLAWSNSLTPPEWRDTEATYLAELQRSGSAVRYEKEYVRKDGSRVPVELLVHLVHDDTGNPPYYHAFVTDLTDRKRVEAMLAERTRQLDAVRAVSEEIARELDLGQLLQLIGSRAAYLVGDGTVTVFLWDETAQVLVRKAFSPGEDPVLTRLTFRLGEGLVGMVAERREGMVVNEYRSWPFAHPEVLARTSLTACLAEPLLYRDRLVGIILVDNRATGRAFTENDRSRIRLLAAPAAIAVENARLHSAAVRRGEELESLLRAMGSVTSGLDLQAILRRIATEAAAMAGAPHVKVLLVDRKTGQIRLEATEGATAGGFPLPIGTSLSGLVAATGDTIFSPDCAHDPRNVMAARDRELGIVTYLGLPIKNREEVVGVLTLNTTEPRDYSPEEMAYLSSFAGQAAIAIENARLYETARRELEERTRTEAALLVRTQHLEAIRAISEEISRELSLPTVLDLINRRAIGLLGGISGTVLLWDERPQVLVPHAWTGLGEWRRDLWHRLGEGVSGKVAERREGMIVNDYRTSPLADPTYLERTAVAATIVEPLLRRERLVGVIAIDRDATGGAYTAEDRDTLRLLAAQAAIAIDNARLFEEQQLAYVELQRAKDELVRSEKLRALGQMAAGIAHDLNNMLAAILGQVELLRLRVDIPEVQEVLKVLYTVASDGAQVVRRLQEFGRQQARIPLLPCDLMPIVQGALELTRPRWRDEAQQQNRPISIHRDLPELPRILGQPAEIREALTNLILNALDAMPTGGTITIAGQIEPTDAPPDAAIAVRLSVTDTGTGMSEEVCSRIFDPFFTTKGPKGTGLGLAVVYAIMERHGGRVDVASILGHGTTFTLRFQVAPREMKEAPGPGQSVSRAPRRLLLIDDEEMVRVTIANLLRAVGHEVTEAESGSAGLARMAECPVDLVITDLGMPEMTGWEVAKQVKAAHPRIPVVLLTGWGDQMRETSVHQAHVDIVLGKPIRLDELQEAIAGLTASGGGP